MIMNYTVRDTVKNTSDNFSFTSDAIAISSMNSGRSAEMPHIIIRNNTTGTIIYTGYAVKENAGEMGTSNTILIVVAIVIIIAIAYFAMRR